jgi:hypothetical protein
VKCSAAIFILFLSLSAFAKDHLWQEGKLLSVANQNDMGIGTAIGTSALLFQTGHAVFLVQISDIVYTVRGEKTNHRTKDYSKGLIVGDQVKAAIEGNKLILLLPDGKNLDTSILTRERVKQ